MQTLDFDVLAQFVVDQAEGQREKTRKWSPEEDQFLRDHMATMTDAEIARALGRSENAVHIRWSRDLALPARSKDPSVMTSRHAARMLGIDEHKINHWMDLGMIKGHFMPANNRKVRLIDRVMFRRWVLNPMNWVWFDPKKVKDPDLKRMCRLRAKRWGDEWWNARQVADYHGVHIHAVNQQIHRGTLPSFHLPVSLGGRHLDPKWSFHFIRKSDAVRAVFLRGKGHRLTKFTPAADAWILRARDQLGMTFAEIGRTMKICKGKNDEQIAKAVSYRYWQLKDPRKKATRKGV